jgi:hypothetical protein
VRLCSSFEREGRHGEGSSAKQSRTKETQEGQGDQGACRIDGLVTAFEGAAARERASQEEMTVAGSMREKLAVFP